MRIIDTVIVLADILQSEVGSWAATAMCRPLCQNRGLTPSIVR